MGELARRGHHTVDTDYGEWEHPPGRWDEDRMSTLLLEYQEIVVSGTVENQGRFYDRFAHVVLLSAPVDVVIERVTTRSDNPYGKTAEDQAAIRRHIVEVEPLLRAGATIEVDGRSPVADVADVVERLLTGT